MTSGTTTTDTADIAADVVLTALRGTVAAIRSEQRKQVQWVAAWGDAHSEDRLRGGLVPDLESASVRCSTGWRSSSSPVARARR